MEERDQEERRTERHLVEDHLDRVLDAALAEYGTVAPRSGIEERILASLRARETKRHGAWWQWSFAALAAMTLMVVVGLAWQRSRTSTPPIVNRRPAPLELVPQKKEVATHDTLDNPRQKSRRRVVRASPEQIVVAAAPKLDQFPSPQPLSEQERFLAMYINQDPEHAALIAEARMEMLRQDEAEKLRTASEDAGKIGR